MVLYWIREMNGKVADMCLWHLISFSIITNFLKKRKIIWIKFMNNSTLDSLYFNSARKILQNKRPMKYNRAYIYKWEIGERGNKLFIFSDDMNTYIENPKESTKKFLEEVSEFSRIIGYTVYTQKSIIFL